MNTRELLRKISLPSRSHPHFHPNVVVPNAVSRFGHKLDLDDYRIAVTADMRHRGDWREEGPPEPTPRRKFGRFFDKAFQVLRFA